MKIKVAVLRGGPSPEYDISLKTGAHILSLMRQIEDKYEPIDIFISKDGEWHRNGLVHDPYQALGDTDMVWNAMHGAYGEDGKVQKLLDSLKIDYTGSGADASARTMDKELAKREYQKHSLLFPRHEVLSEETLNDDQLVYIVREYLQPVIVKPASAGSSIGVKLAHGFHELKEAVKNAFAHSSQVLVEGFIRGKEATCGVVEGMRGEKLYALIPYGGTTPEENQKIVEMSKIAHEILGLRNYSSSDFIITPRGKIYMLETDSQPAFYPESRMYKSLLSTGIKPREFAEHCIGLVLEKS